MATHEPNSHRKLAEHVHERHSPHGEVLETFADLNNEPSVPLHSTLALLAARRSTVEGSHV